MNKFFMLFFLIIVIVIGILVFLYFTYEKPQQNTPDEYSVNMTIYSYDKYENKLISVNFEIYKYDAELNEYLLVNEGTTSKEGGILKSMQINNTYMVISKNSSYYTFLIINSIFDNDNTKRFDLYLEKPGELIYNLSKTNEKYHYILALNTKDRPIKNISICLKNSVNLIGISANGIDLNITIIEKLSLYESYDKCYYIGTINGTEYKLNVYPQAYIDPNSRDFIEIAIIDKDCNVNFCLNQKDGIDLGMKDVIIKEFIIK